MTFDIDWSKFLPFIVAIVCLIVGWAFGYWDSNSRASKKIQAAEAKSEAAIRQAKAEAQQALARAAQVAEKPAPAPAPSAPGISLLRLWLDEKESPQLDLDGQPVHTRQIPEPQRKRLVQLVTVMRPWIEGRPTEPTPVAQTHIPRPVPPASQPTPAPVFAPASVPAPTGFIPPIAPVKDDRPVKPLSMVGQIDEILQLKLTTTTFAGRGIRLQESPTGGVTVVVGGKNYEGVGDVPDAEVQAIIRAAIAEWENKYTPGL